VCNLKRGNHLKIVVINTFDARKTPSERLRSIDMNGLSGPVRNHILYSDLREPIPLDHFLPNADPEAWAFRNRNVTVHHVSVAISTGEEFELVCLTMSANTPLRARAIAPSVLRPPEFTPVKPRSQGLSTGCRYKRKTSVI